HAGLRRAHDIEQRIMADVQDLAGSETGLITQSIEYAHIGLGGTGRNGRDVALEPTSDPATLEVRIAVAQGKQTIAFTQAFKRRLDLGVQRHAISLGVENFE